MLTRLGDIVKYFGAWIVTQTVLIALMAWGVAAWISRVVKHGQKDHDLLHVKLQQEVVDLVIAENKRIITELSSKLYEHRGLSHILSELESLH